MRMADPATVELDHLRIVEVLNRHQVRYVVIGGMAAVLHGSLLATSDIDVTPDDHGENRARLAAALAELDAHLLVPGHAEPVGLPLDAESIGRFQTLTLRTSAGDLDLSFRPDAPAEEGGSFRYARLVERALVYELPERVLVADLADVIASKAAAGREKDLARLPELRRLQQSRARRQGPGGEELP